MKPKSFEKKLSLNKKTVAHLSNGQEKKIMAGKPPSVDCSYLPCTGPTWCQRTCPTFMGCPTCSVCGDGSAC
jgi:hypothetical protein